MAFGKEQPSQPPDLKSTAAVTVIARDTRLIGEISGSRAVRVEGGVQGKVELRATLEIAEGATVEAEVHASAVRIAGAVTGNVTATQRVELLATARVKGDVSTPALHVVEGAKLEGRVHMVPDAASVAPGPTASELEKNS
ncbi:MAG: polymer-forming cytoskeletal protein [Acidobacteria bacterium]|nr:polymer-forming cytoskeletal protein [Acidobacteriota bacterium]